MSACLPVHSNVYIQWLEDKLKDFRDILYSGVTENCRLKLDKEADDNDDDDDLLTLLLLLG